MPFFEIRVDKRASLVRRALHIQVKLDRSAGRLTRALPYSLYDWTQDMSWSSRLLTTIGLVIQVGALCIGLVGARSGLLGPSQVLLFPLIAITYTLGLLLMNAMLTSEFVRKTQLEADQLAAQQIQQTLHPQKLEPLPGYQLQMFYKPLRAVGGDYFDIIELAQGRTLIAVADVSGKGMPAALLAANIQALVRSITTKEVELASWAGQINGHLCAYTPENRFATAIFIVLSHENGDLAYVNAGHNAPILYSSGYVTYLESTGMPLGLFAEAKFGCHTVTMPSEARLLVFTDGLPDGIGGQSPEQRICDTLKSDAEQTIPALEALIDPTFHEDDVSMLLVRRLGSMAPARIANASTCN